MADINVTTGLLADDVVVVLTGELDVTDTARVGRAMGDAAPPGSRIIVDLAELTFIDCGSLSALASARVQALRAGGDLLLTRREGRYCALFLSPEWRGCCRYPRPWNTRTPGPARRPGPPG